MSAVMPAQLGVSAAWLTAMSAPGRAARRRPARMLDPGGQPADDLAVELGDKLTGIIAVLADLVTPFPTQLTGHSARWDVAFFYPYSRAQRVSKRLWFGEIIGSCLS